MAEFAGDDGDLKRRMTHLIQHGAQVNCGRDSDGLTPLHWACSKGWVDQVRLILEKGGRVVYRLHKSQVEPSFHS
ncbi:hypothetical protein JTE90_015313 [Oedothorax gibbosus]|uniref:Uncharacterized protein n=1 Tax=Oedothorax gibbosus TaxID=931172 RepID=A0AAV6VNI0_9ARAC|nr:hypothetical protein JTE90_015313 [Oedothorax gibbosus]